MNTDGTDRSGDPQTYAIIGAAMEVHSQLGHGFLEAVYQEAMERECAARGIPFRAGVKLPAVYKGQRLKATYRADLICYGKVIVEMKALARLTNLEQGQLINYLKATGLHRGLLLNFGAPRLECKRVVFGLPDIVEHEARTGLPGTATRGSVADLPSV